MITSHIRGKKSGKGSGRGAVFKRAMVPEMANTAPKISVQRGNFFIGGDLRGWFNVAVSKWVSRAEIPESLMAVGIVS
jgi:hypothetical protein